ncbi:MAG: HD domain-containing protein, partial [Burkholderiales bacterium]
VRFAALVHDLGKGETPPGEWPAHRGHERRSVALVRALCERLRVPRQARDLAVLAAAEHGMIHRAGELGPAAIVRLLERTDALRRPERFTALLQACEADFRGRLGYEDRPFAQAPRLLAALRACRDVPAAAIARSLAAEGRARPEAIRSRLHEARVHAVRTALRD